MSTVEQAAPGPWTFHPETRGGEPSNFTTDEFMAGAIRDANGHAVAYIPERIESRGQDVTKTARLLAAAPDFFAACEGAVFPDISRLEWLAGLIGEFQRRSDRLAELDPDGMASEDPDADGTALREVMGLLTDLRSAVAKATGNV